MRSKVNEPGPALSGADAEAAEVPDAPSTDGSDATEAAVAPAPSGAAADPARSGPEATDLPRDRRARAARILELLDRYVPAPAIPLDHGDAFQLLVAVILSAQCTDARVNMVTPALFARASDARAMAQLRSSQIKPFIRTCGLADGKARAIAKLSRILVREHGGQVPHDLALLETLPGVGHKTASVVVAQAFGEPAFPVDTHIHRLAGRWQLSRARTVQEVEHDLKQLFPRERWSTLHLQFIYFGRQYCTAKGHVPAECPICSWAMSKARALREERQGLSKPLTRPKKARRLATQPQPQLAPPELAAAPHARRAQKPARVPTTKRTSRP
jgi:endonuclease-3